MKKGICCLLICILIFTSIFILCKSKINSTKDNKISGVTSIMPHTEDTPVVCIDAGHGFGDPGCESKLLSGIESEVTLEITKLLKNELESAGIKVILTHDGKTYPSYQTIINMVNKNNIDYDEKRLIDNNVFSAYERVIYASAINRETPIDLFISIHINSIENHPEVSRYELYYYENNPYDYLLQSFVVLFHKSLIMIPKYLLRNRTNHILLQDMRNSRPYLLNVVMPLIKWMLIN